jgi:hypothetical protein
MFTSTTMQLMLQQVPHQQPQLQYLNTTSLNQMHVALRSTETLRRQKR